MKKFLHHSPKKYSGRFVVRVPSMVHQKLALEVTERGVGMERLVSAK
ncbi:toxin-antitoxin system HicB family antitoxin [Acinetobacter geminorum]